MTKLYYVEEKKYMKVIFPIIGRENDILKNYSIDREESLSHSAICSAMLLLAEMMSGIIEVPSNKEGYALFVESEEKTNHIFYHRVGVLFEILRGVGDSSQYVKDIIEIRKEMMKELLE